jgi:hypothetical protein
MSTAAKEADAVAAPQEQQLIAAGQLLHALSRDAKFRPRVLEIIKEAAPDTPIFEIDVAASADAKVLERTKPLIEENKSLRADLDAIQKHINRQSFAQKMGLEDEELVEVEELAGKGKIGDPETAVELYRLRQGPGTPRGTKQPIATAEFREKIQKIGPRNGPALRDAALTEASRIITEMRRGRRTA